MNAIVVAPTEQAAAPFTDRSGFEHAQRVGKALAASSLVPDTYRDNLANVLIAMDVANRIGASPLAVMQNLHIIHGRPAWGASFLIATVNACGRFTPLRFEQIGDDPFDKAYRVRAHAKDREGGDLCEGPWITWKMVETEGWSKKAGSKWLSMPALMFMYRAAAFWTRVYAPEQSLGIRTADEESDIHAAHVIDAPARGDLGVLQEQLRQRALTAEAPIAPDVPAEPEIDTSTGEITDTAEAVAAAMTAATHRDQLDEAADRISLVPKAGRAALVTQYEAELERITAA